MDKKQPAPPPPVSVEEKNKKQARASPPFPAVLFVSVWALYNAAVIAFAFAMQFILCAYNAYAHLPSWLFQDVELTGAQDAMGSALMLGIIWCSAAEAAAGTLALLLTGHRRRRWIRRVLAYTALAAAVAAHCLYASATGIVVLAADPGYLFVRIGGTGVILFFAAGDLLGFLALLRGGE